MSSQSSQDAIVPHTTRSSTSGKGKATRHCSRGSVTAEKWSNRRRRRGFSQSVLISRGSHPSELPRNHECRWPLRAVNPSPLPCVPCRHGRVSVCLELVGLLLWGPGQTHEI